MKKTFIIITTLILSLLFTSCITSSDVTYKVKYIVNDEVYLTKEVKANEKVDNIEAPELEYYEFTNWLNKETNEPYDFALTLNNDLELIAEYSKIANLAGGEEGKYYDFSNLTDEELIEIAKKLENFLMDQALSIPFYNTVYLHLLSERIKYPVDKSFEGYELYSDFTGENVFRYAIEKIKNTFVYNTLINRNLIFKGLYSYEYNEDLLSNKLVPYFAKGDPVCLDEKGYVWKVYIDEGFKFSDGSDVKFEDFVNAYELNLKNDDAIPYGLDEIKNAWAYYNSECKREDVGIEYNYEEKSIIFTFNSAKNKNLVKDALENPTLSPIPFFELIENEDYSKYKFVGEYALKSFENNVITYEKNPFYVNKNGVLKTFEKIEYYYVDDKNTGYSMFIEGLVDYVELPNELFDEYYHSESNMVEIYGTTYGLHLNLNETVGKQNHIMLSQNFRKALYYGINREVFNDKFKSCDQITNPCNNLDLFYRILYPYNPENIGYDSELSLDYYVKALDELIKKGEISNNEKTTIKLSVICYENSQKYEEVLNSYESLFNSQTKYSNIRIKFELNVLTTYEMIQKFIEYSYDIAFFAVNAGTDVIAVLSSWTNNYSSYVGAMYSNSIVYTAIKNNLIEFRGELYTYATLVNVLDNEYKSVYIRNGKIE